MCWPNPSYGNENTKWISTCVDKTPPKPTRTQDETQLDWTNQSLHNKDTKCITTCVLKTQPMSARTLNASQLVWPNTLPWQLGHEMHLNMCWPNPSLAVRKHKMYLNLCWPKPTHAREDTKSISTCDNQIRPMKTRTQNTSQLVLTKPERKQKMYLYLWWPNPTHAREDTTFVDNFLLLKRSQ